MRAEKLQTAIRRRQLAEATLALIAERGVTDWSLADVAERVGLVTSGIYRHYAGKDELLLAVIDLIGGRLRAEVEGAQHGAGGILDQLRELLDRHIGLIQSNSGIPRLVFSETVFGEAHEQRRRLDGVVNEYLAAVATIIAAGQGRGEICADLDPEVAAIMFLGLVQTPAILWRLSDGAFDIETQTERSWAMFRRMISRESANGHR